MKVDKVEETFYINNYFLSITGSENFHQESRKKNLMQFFTGLQKGSWDNELYSVHKHTFTF